MKCDICGKKIELTFLNKPIGSYMRNSKGKKKIVCSDCQRTHSKEELKTKL
ncbi:hypothetical protein JXB28_06155 [Candidatus Woesearchaeota archaeon]|nr:hypothetical protein [Candidatus Woesearchaeota archaeon]